MEGNLDIFGSWSFDDFVEMGSIDPRAPARLLMDVFASYFASKKKLPHTEKRTEPVDITQEEVPVQTLDQILAS